MYGLGRAGSTAHRGSITRGSTGANAEERRQMGKCMPSQLRLQGAPLLGKPQVDPVFWLTRE